MLRFIPKISKALEVVLQYGQPLSKYMVIGQQPIGQRHLRIPSARVQPYRPTFFSLTTKLLPYRRTFTCS
jgi:hypothetical protein